MSIISNENKFRMSSPSIGSFDYKNPYQKYNSLVNADIIYIYILHTSNPTTAIHQITKMVPYTKSLFNKQLLQPKSGAGPRESTFFRNSTHLTLLRMLSSPGGKVISQFVASMLASRTSLELVFLLWKMLRLGKIAQKVELYT